MGLAAELGVVELRHVPLARLTEHHVFKDTEALEHRVGEGEIALNLGDQVVHMLDPVGAGVYERLGAVLVRLNLATERQIAKALAYQLGFPYLNLAENPPDPQVVSLIAKDVALKRSCVAIRLDKNLLTVAMAALTGYSSDGHVKLAAAVEFMHTATLLHDDVVDNSEMRRGRLAARNGHLEAIADRLRRR